MTEPTQTQAVTTAATTAAGQAPAAEPATTTQAPATTTTQAVEDVASLPEWARKAIEELRKENASHRTAKTKAEKAAQEAAERAAAEQGKFRELYESVKPKAERAEALEGYLATLLEQELASVPEKYRSLVPAFDDPLKKLEWVRSARAAGILAAPAAPATDAGRGTGGQGAARAAVSQAEELEVWRRLGLDHAVRAVESGKR